MYNKVNRVIKNSVAWGIYYGIIFGIIIGTIRSVVFIHQHHYLSYNLQQVIYYLVQYIINYYVCLFTAVLVFVFILINIHKKLKQLFFTAFLFFITFGIIAYFLNTKVLPGFYQLESIRWNGILFLVCVFFSYSLSKLYVPKLAFVKQFYDKKILLILILVFIFFNGFAEILDHDTKFIDVSGKISSKKFISLFNLNYPGLENVKRLVKQHNFDSAKSKLIDYFKSKEPDSSLVNFEAIEQLDSAQVTFAATDIIEHKFTNVGKKYYLGEQIDWSKNPDSNNEWIWKLNRHSQWLRLAWAYQKTKDEKYTIEFNNLLMSWIKNNPPMKWKNEKSHTWRLMDAGERMFVSWIKLYQLFNSSAYFTDEVRTFMLASLYNHAQFLKLFKSPTRNHLLMESRGIAYVAVYFPEFKLATEWEDVAFERVEHAIETEINNDGSYCELSTGYQWLALKQFKGFIELAKKRARTLNGEEKVIKMYEFLMNLIRPDGKLPELNDGFPPQNIRSILLQIGNKYDKPEFIYQGTLGKEGKKPDYNSCQLPDAGYYVMRTDWGENANYLFFDAGPYGSAHGHDDKLSFECNAYGKTIICDAGTYTSDPLNKYVDYFHRSPGHNTIMVDGKSQARFWNRKDWVYNSSQNNDNEWQSNEKYDYVVSDYKDGYGNYKEKIDRSVKHVRKIIFIKPEYWVISDLLVANDEHTYQQLFHFVPTKLFVNDKKTVFTNNKNEANLAIFHLNPDNLNIQILEGSDDPIQGWVSEGYNRKHAAPAVIYSKQANGSTTFNTILYPLSQGYHIDNVKVEKIMVNMNGKELDETEAVCLKFINKKWIDYIMLADETSGLKNFSRFESDGSVAYLRVDTTGKVINKFVINGNVLNLN